jgi:hypothetical protein
LSGHVVRCDVTGHVISYVERTLSGHVVLPFSGRVARYPSCATVGTVITQHAHTHTLLFTSAARCYMTTGDAYRAGVRGGGGKNNRTTGERRYRAGVCVGEPKNRCARRRRGGVCLDDRLVVLLAVAELLGLRGRRWYVFSPTVHCKHGVNHWTGM